MTAGNYNISSDPNLAFKGEEIPQDLKIFFLIMGWVLVTNGVFGNVVIIVTLCTCKSLRSVHNLFIGNLAVADLIIESYFASCFLVDIWIGNHPVVDMDHCIYNGYTIVICYMSSLWTLVSINFNRYLHICHHQKFKKLFTDCNTKCLLALVWIWAGILSMPPLLGWGRYSYDPKSHYCGFDRLSSRSFTIVLATTSVALPACLVCYFNMAIFRYVRTAGQRIQTWAAIPKRGVSKSDIALMKSLFVVFVCLAVFMSPYMLSLLIDTDNSWSSSAHVACTITSILNSSINWILYGLMNQQFRQGYRELLDRFVQCLRLRKSPSPVDQDASQKPANTVESVC